MQDTAAFAAPRRTGMVLASCEYDRPLLVQLPPP
jgi:hypothetical protein